MSQQTIKVEVSKVELDDILEALRQYQQHHSRYNETITNRVRELITRLIQAR